MREEEGGGEASFKPAGPSIERQRCHRFTLVYLFYIFDFQGEYPTEFDRNYMSTVSYLADEYLLNESKEDLFAKICFMKPHPMMNKQLLNAAIIKTILGRPDFSNDILNPMEVILIIIFFANLNLSHLSRGIISIPDLAHDSGYITK